MFCTKCGKELPDGARFCFECGQVVHPYTPNQIESPTSRQAVFVGKLIKCPNCGENLDSFTIKCPSCGYELRNIQATSSVKELATRIQQVEASRPREKKHLLYTHLNYSATDEQLANIVSSFAIPNSKEDLLDFLILASSNIKLEAYAFERHNMSAGQRMIHEAWLSKFEQAYNKAHISFANDPEFSSVEEIYRNKMQQIDRKKRMSVVCWIALFAAPWILFGIVALISFLCG